MKAIWVNKAKSYEAAQEFDDACYRKLSPAQRVETVQVLREAHFRTIGGLKSEDGKRYEEFLALLNRHDVRYCIVGSYALAFHAKPRYTKDLDILIEASGDNAENLLRALNDFGFGSLALSSTDFAEENNIIQLGYEPVRIDILTTLQGMAFSDIWQNRVQGPYGNQTANYIDRKHLIESKQISNRTQDKADLELLLQSEP
jgi:hypothetical protein